jgi:DNA-binding response OmpR family regulator
VLDLPIILVVEDEPLIQGLIEEALSDGGFDMAMVASGEEALTLLNGNKDKYRALVTDISLDGKIEGWEVARHAGEIDPEYPVIYTSGASAEDWASKGVPNSVMLAKPFAPAQLVTAISNLLNAATPTT